MKKHDVTFDCGARYSVKCQFAQLENIVRDAIEETEKEAAKQALFRICKLINEENRITKNARSFAVAHVLNELSDIENSNNL
jgi:hypothetical protein